MAKLDELDKILKTKQDEFNTFVKTSVIPLIGEESAKNSRETFAEAAKRISDDSIQKQYCELVIEMQKANINYYRPQATLISVPEKDSTYVIASTLIFSAWMYSEEANIASTLFVAGIWYLLAGGTYNTHRRTEFKSAAMHNELTPTWIESIKDWEKDIEELKEVIRENKWRNLD
jgi:hypothetical protein